jgi:peroxiredoxin Q/BCP
MGVARKLRDLAGLARDALGLGRDLMLKPGDKAPPFDVLDHQGKRRTLDDFRGKKLLLWFYPKADTPG